MVKQCLFCKNEYKTILSLKDRSKFCCKKCKVDYFKGKHLSKGSEFKKGIIPWNKGKKNPYTKDVIERMRLAKLGKKGNKKTLVARINHSMGALRGSESPAWRGGVTKENEKFRKSIGYKLWRESVFKKDNYTCQVCGERGGKLNADHIKYYSLYPEHRLDVDNGQTLCFVCHTSKTKKDMVLITKVVRRRYAGAV